MFRNLKFIVIAEGKAIRTRGEMGKSENSNDLQNPVNESGKAENPENDIAVAMSRN